MKSKSLSKDEVTIMQWVLIYMFSSFIGLILMFPTIFVFGCSVDENGASCTRLPNFLEDFVYSGMLFSVWGAAVTIPSGLFVLIILAIDSYYRRYRNNKKD